MADYLHGAYGNVYAAGTRDALVSQPIVYIGTAPVHTLPGGGDNVNKPVLVNNIGEARRMFGYSEDWASYTLCEPMYVHLLQKGVGPLVLINVLDPAKHKAAAPVTTTATPSGGRALVTGAENAILDSVTVEDMAEGEDYTLTYDHAKNTLVFSEVEPDSLGSAPLTITYDEVDPSEVDEDVIIGESDDEGINTGIYAVRSVYPATGAIPSMLMCPGFAEIPKVHEVMVALSTKINGHWDTYLYVDLPLVDATNKAIKLSNVAKWKNDNGYTRDNETVYFPMAEGVDGRKYHLSVLAAANLQELNAAQSGIPYKTASNTESAAIRGLFMGAGSEGRYFDDEIINRTLNQHGIASAAYMGGRWVIWGAHSAAYDQERGDQINVSETNRMMLNYLSNDFQKRRVTDVDQPMSVNRIRAIIAEEQARLDALIKIGAICHGQVVNNDGADRKSDIMRGDFLFTFLVTVTPLGKSLTANVTWTDKGFETYFTA